jgi:hypothetical protein
MNLHCFGASTPSGQALREQAPIELVGYSRSVLGTSGWLHPADLSDPSGFMPAGRPHSPAIWISFAPIWLLAPFLNQLALYHPERLQGLCGVIACSSSSSVTKRFAANHFDRQLVARLTSAEDHLLATCRKLSITCCILRPTLIYGQAGGVGDRNLSRLIELMRRFPLLPLPAESGLRQPIHVSQLAAVALHLAHQLARPGSSSSLPECIALGGDITLTYAGMIRALQQSQPSGDPARRCILLHVPNRLFFLLAAPLLIPSPKAFEAVLRMGADLSGFTPAHQLLGEPPQPFPVMPLSR